MKNLDENFKEKVRSALVEARGKHSGSDSAFAKSMGIGASIYSRLKNGETERILATDQWVRLARELSVNNRSNNWKIARTEVYDNLEGNLEFCKDYSKSMILIDECGVGKSECSRHIVKGMKDAFYMDCAQSKTKLQFIRALAKLVGLDSRGRYIDLKANLKYYLANILDKPLIVLDDAGYLKYDAFLDIHELWNATEGYTGWYMIGDDSLETKIRRGQNSKKVGYKAIFSRFNEDFVHVLPAAKGDRDIFMLNLMNEVAELNNMGIAKKKIDKIVRGCWAKGVTLRPLRTAIEINANG